MIITPRGVCLNVGVCSTRMQAHKRDLVWAVASVRFCVEGQKWMVVSLAMMMMTGETSEKRTAEPPRGIASRNHFDISLLP